MINEFRGKYFFLSNFFLVNVEYEGLVYGSSEAAFQAAKTLDINIRQIFTKMSPSDAKGAGRQIKLRPNWEKIKDQIMEDIVRCKFKQHPELMESLINTGQMKLVEGNNWGDDYWGVIRSTGIGQNKLGKILMKIRNEQYKYSYSNKKEEL